MGKKGEQLTDARAELQSLRDITRDLTEASIRGEMQDASHLTQLKALDRRLQSLESQR